MPLFWRRRSEQDFSNELQAHLDIEADRLMAEGWSPDEARRAAQRAFGNVVAVRERFHDAGRWIWLEQAAADLRYAGRALRHSPAFVATAVLTLAVGLAFATVAFTVFNAYVLRPLPVRDPSGLHQIGWRSPDGAGRAMRWRDYQALRERRDFFEAVIGEHSQSLSSGGRLLLAAFVSDNYFESLRPQMLLGRPLGGNDDVSSDRPPVVLSRAGWVRLFPAGEDAIGRELDIEGRPFVVIGVLRHFTGLDDSPRDAWLPAAADPALARRTPAGDSEPAAVEITARLRPGVTAASAQRAITPALAMMVGRPGDVRAEVMALTPSNPLSFHMLALLSPIVVALGLVLAAACANVSNMMLARALGRGREIAVRLSLGASRGRVVRQLLAEGLLVALLVGLTGLALASWLLRGATAIMYGTLPPSLAAAVRLLPLDLDHRVFLFTLGAATGATLLCALIPALQASSLSLTSALQGQGGGAGRRSSRLRALLVTGQVAVSLVVIVGALTFARNGAAVGGIDLGYETRGVVSVNVRAPQAGLVPGLAAVLAADPRVAAVAVTSRNPLSGRARTVMAVPEQGPGAATPYTFVSPEYFSILQMPIERGRGFLAAEASAGAPVAVVSAAAARRFWPDQDPIGRSIRIERSTSPRPPGRRVRTIAGALRSERLPLDDLPGYSHLTVVGLVGDVVSGRMVDGVESGHIYLPISPDRPQAAALLMRGHADRDLDARVQQQLFRQAAAAEVLEGLPLDERRAVQMYPLLAISWIGTLLGAVALILSVSGLYGVLVYLLGQRTREIGIRMALGATGGAIMRLVVRQSVRLAGIGAIAGVAAAGGMMRVLSAAIQLDAVSLFDLTAFAGALALVLTAAALAAVAPARRAARVDPVYTLRIDG